MNHGGHGEHGGILHKEITDRILDGAFRVHRNLGPGLLESVYEACMAHEFSKQDLKFERQKALPVRYDGLVIDGGFRIDLLVENAVIVELKTVESINSIHHAQLITYLKLSGLRLGLLINFNVKFLKDGIKRVAL